MNRVLKERDYKITNNYSSKHQAVDIVGKNNTLDYIVAHTDGVVVMSVTGKKNNKGSIGNESYGNFVKIKHSSNYYTLYAHMKNVKVKVGSKVKKGQIIGYMSDSGNAYGKHLHFEVMKGNKRLNPKKYLDSNLPNQTEYYARYTGSSNSIVDALKSLNINSSFNNRKSIAIKNGITNYKGTATQNIKLLKLLKDGKLIKK